MPGSPTTVTSCGVSAATAFAKMPFRSATSISRPMNGVSWSRDGSATRESGLRAWKIRTGSALPFSVAASSSS